MIEKLRGRIDEIDEEILSLLNERITTARKIGKEKENRGLSIEDEAREQEVLERLQKFNDGPISDSSVQRIFRRIIEETKQSEGEVAYNDYSNETGSQR